LEQTTLLSPKLAEQEENNQIPQKFSSNAFSTQSNSNQNSNPQYYTGSGTKFKSYSPYKDVTANPNQ
jgi:hypothetical protein